MWLSVLSFYWIIGRNILSYSTQRHKEERNCWVLVKNAASKNLLILWLENFSLLRLLIPAFSIELQFNWISTNVIALSAMPLLIINSVRICSKCHANHPSHSPIRLSSNQKQIPHAVYLIRKFRIHNLLPYRSQSNICFSFMKHIHTRRRGWHIQPSATVEG